MIEETSPSVPSKRLARYIAETSLEPDRLYSLEELEHSLGLSWQQVRSASRAANRILEKQFRRTITWVKGEGIRILPPSEFRIPVRTRLVRMANQGESAVHTLRHVDDTLLSPLERADKDQTLSGVLAAERPASKARRVLDGLND